MVEIIGQTINGYEIIEELARGGMATVYRAHQLSMNRTVAVKVLPREFLHEPTFLERFKQEASIAAQLEHRAIVPVFDYGEWEGMPYIIMRHMEGGSVDKLLKKNAKPLPLEQTQQIIRQIASGLDYAHAEGVLHRDLKPSNILLDRSGDAYLTDFGIARLTSNNVQLTTSGVVGTPAYMSPEQAQGLELDHRSDIYALGVVLYELLTGRRPFEGETPYSVAVMHVTQQPKSPREVNPELAPGVEYVILKAMDKDREKRFRSSVELAGALDDADLLPVVAMMKLEEQPTMPAASILTVPTTNPEYGSYSSTHPTPRRIMPAVHNPTPSSVMPVPTQRRSSVAYLGMAIVLAVILSLLILGAYLAFPPDLNQNPPEFRATGIFKLTATTDAVSSASSTNPENEIIFTGFE